MKPGVGNSAWYIIVVALVACRPQPRGTAPGVTDSLHSQREHTNVSGPSATSWADTARLIVEDALEAYAEDTLMEYYDALPHTQPAGTDHYHYHIVAGDLLKDGAHYAALAYSDTDSTMVFRWCRRHGGEWRTLLQGKERVDFGWGADYRVFDFSDHNGDGRRDFGLRQFQGQGFYTSINVKIWLNLESGWKAIRGFEQIVNAEYDPKARVIYSYFAMRGDMDMFFGVYRFQADSVRHIGDFAVYCADELAPCTLKINDGKPLLLTTEKAMRRIPAYWREAIRGKMGPGQQPHRDQ